MSKGTRFIEGREFLLYGRMSDKDKARNMGNDLRHDWAKVRVIKLSNWDYMIYVHGRIV